MEGEKNLGDHKLVKLNINQVKDYAWGSTKKQSSVGRFSSHNKNNYAQLWIGTHPAGCSKLNQNLNLAQYLKSKNMENLNFLFKILSIQKSLSIQVHPNKQQAINLNKIDSSTYKDDNDKPQMFLTISQQFQAFLGFIEKQQLENILQLSVFEQYRKVQTQTTEENQNLVNQKWRTIQIIKHLMNLSQQDVKSKINQLFNQQKQKEKLIKLQRFQIMKRLQEQHPFDIGILVSCFLKYKILPYGSCFGIPAGVPHTYIRGQCFEVMRNSDNVVRLGLTPKKKDAQNVLKILIQNIQNNIQKSEILNQNNNKVIMRHVWRQFQMIELNTNKFNKDKQSNEQHKHISQGFGLINQIQFEFQSLAIVYEGQFKFKNKQNKSPQQQCKLKYGQAFYLQKGKFVFQGQGRIIFALMTQQKNLQ